MNGSRTWRIRMKLAIRGDLSTKAWDRAEAGVWYGGWSVEDWTQAQLLPGRERVNYLIGVANHQRLGWDPTLNLDAVYRFDAIGPNDWLLVYLRDRAELALAQVEPGLLSRPDHPLNGELVGTGGREIFKYYRLRNQKVFKVPDLPDAYHLLPSQGQGNIHQLLGMHRHVELLVSCADVGAVRAEMAAMPLPELVRFLGAIAWESLCTGYLSLEHGFIHTGLSTGGTLPTFDIVGRRLSDGMHVFAQCKKDPNPVEVQDSFKVALGAHTGPALAFYFAYGGCRGDVPAGVQVFDKDTMLEWLMTDRGRRYRELLLGTSAPVR